MWAFPHLLPCWELPRALHGSQEPARGAVGIPGIPQVESPCALWAAEQVTAVHLCRWQCPRHCPWPAHQPFLCSSLGHKGNIKQPGWPTQRLQEQWQSWRVLVSRFSSLQPSSSFNINNTNTTGNLYLQICTQRTKKGTKPSSLFIPLSKLKLCAFQIVHALCVLLFVFLCRVRL